VDGAVGGLLEVNHPIITTDYFEFGTTVNTAELAGIGAAVEMGDAMLGLALKDTPEKPKWAVVRNMSDALINGQLPPGVMHGGYHLNEQSMWAAGYYMAYGGYTSICSALVTWAIIAGLAERRLALTPP
jgi:hypothetical protein